MFFGHPSRLLIVLHLLAGYPAVALAEARPPDAGGCQADPYALAVGPQGASRLAVSEQTYGAATVELVRKLKATRPAVWPVGPLHILVVGCGSGVQLPSLARWAGSGGSLTCSDISPAQLDLAREVARREGPHNVNFRSDDAERLTITQAFDVVYSRFVLVHLQHPEAALSHMWAAVKPGGLLISEEHDIDGIRSIPMSPALREFKALLTRLSAHRGVKPA